MEEKLILKERIQDTRYKMTVSFMTKFETNMSKKISEEYGMKIFQMCSRSLKYILPHAHAHTHAQHESYRGSRGRPPLIPDFGTGNESPA